MRLIDADKANVYTYEFDKQVFVDVITRFISLQPTVEAIPVDWILDWLYKYEAAYKTREDVTRMLNDWRKENEELV